MSLTELSAWFQYLDKDKSPYNPTVGDLITVEKFWDKKSSKYNLPDWRKEQWQISSALVPVNQLDNAATIIKSPYDLKFDTGWNFQDQFNFGDYSHYGDIDLYPLVLLIKHPITKEFNVELSRDFFTYHALLKDNNSQYYHPVDNILVAEAILDPHQYYDPTASVTVHRHYLRDFLAALNMGLLICVVADRFANATTEEELGLEEIEDKQVDDFNSISTSIHKPEFTDDGFFSGRSILQRNFIIRPYDQPIFERSPWCFFGKTSIEETEYPRFIVNSEAKKQILPQNTYIGNYIEQGIGQYGYLHFRPEVLQKYLQTPGYNVFFHTRNWGVASLPGDRGTIDVGINSQGLVNAFAPDIADLNPSEQAYWSSFSSIPSGDICEEMFQTRMQNNPPHSPGTTELIEEALFQLDTIFQKQFSVPLFNDIKPDQKNLNSLSIGVFSSQYNDVLELAKILYGWVIETMQIGSLRDALTALGKPIDNKLRQIKLLENILMAKGIDQAQARSITAPLVALNELRGGSAHIGNPDLENCFRLMGESTIPQTPRKGWNLCVDAVVSCLNSIISAFAL